MLLDSVRVSFILLFLWSALLLLCNLVQCNLFQYNWCNVLVPFRFPDFRMFKENLQINMNWKVITIWRNIWIRSVLFDLFSSTNLITWEKSLNYTKFFFYRFKTFFTTKCQELFLINSVNVLIGNSVNTIQINMLEGSWQYIYINFILVLRILQILWTAIN